MTPSTLRSLALAATPIRHGNRFRDLTGMTFGNLTVLSLSPGEYGSGKCSSWLCQCSCGNRKIIAGGNLSNGHTRSCGCLRRLVARTVNTIHGQVRNHEPTVEYTAWTSMKQRCAPHSKARRWYYDRGIKVCPEWQSDFNAFLSHIGPRPIGRYSLDRINNDLGYEPGNVRWATPTQQNNNKRKAKTVNRRPTVVPRTATGEKIWRAYNYKTPRPTHCPHGHIYDKENTYLNNRKRHCRACSKIKSSLYEKSGRRPNRNKALAALNHSPAHKGSDK